MRIEDKFAQNEIIFNNKFKDINSDKSNNESNNSVNFWRCLKKGSR